MIWLIALGVLVIATPVVLWPLITHWQPEPEPRAAPAAEGRELEEIELDVASGRISEGEAARRRRELS